MQASTLTGNVTLNPSGQLWGNGTVIGIVVNGGLLTPGTATTPGALAINGNYSQQPSGTLSLRVNGVPTSGNFDSLSVSGNASLAGSLSVANGGYSPSLGDTFTVLTATSVTGMFNNGSNLVPAGPAFFKVGYSSNTVTLQPTCVITFYDEYPNGPYSPGHAFLEMTNAKGVSAYLGFYPYNRGWMISSGTVNNDSATPWNYAIEYPVSASAYSAAATLIENDVQSPPSYNLIKFNCTDFVKSIAAAANIQLPNTTGLAGTSDPYAFGYSLLTVGNGNTTYGGTVIFNPDPPQTQPYDYSYAELEQGGHSSAGSLASYLGLPLDRENLGTVISNSVSGISISLSGANTSNDLISMNWGDGYAYQEQSLNFSHVYAPGTYTADLLDIDDGALHSYDMTVDVSSSASSPVNINVTPFSPVENVNPNLTPPVPVPAVPEPSTLAIAICAAVLLSSVRHCCRRPRSIREPLR